VAVGGLAAVAAMGCSDRPPLDPVIDPPENDPIAASIVITPSSVEFRAIGSSTTVAAAVKNASGATLADQSVDWSMAGTGVARVDSTGRLVAIANGVDTVRAAVGDLVASAVVRVVQVPFAVTIGSHAQTMTVLGETAALSAAVLDSLGSVVRGLAIEWRSSDPRAVPIDAQGLATAASMGSAVITATSGVMVDSTNITVDLLGPLGAPRVGSVISCASGTAAPFDCNGIDLVAYLPISALGGPPGVTLNDVWGWTDRATGNSYALVGRTDGVSFVDVTDPLAPVYVGFLPRTAGSPQAVWRDIKVYVDHAFVVADGSFEHGVQVFDLGRLRSFDGAPQVFAETARYSGVASVHNIVINETTGFAYAVGSNSGGESCGGGLHMIDVRLPGAPRFAGCFADPLTGFSGTGYTHDAQCVRYVGPDPDYAGRDVCLGSNETALSIADVTDPANPVAISRASYPNVGYAHQGWLTDDHRYFYLDDEVDELQGSVPSSRTIIWDVTDLDDPIVVGAHFGPNRATDHNLYIKGDLLYQSNYQYGLRVVNIADRERPVDIGYFDTAPTRSNEPGFGGSWSNYPFFPSGIIVVTSQDEGLFLLQVSN
jgi:choice-of-anchor B domain-containing protein